MQISAPVSPGSSGSPVVNLHGEVVGIVRSGIATAQALNFAVPVERVTAIQRDSPVDFRDWYIKNESHLALSSFFDGDAAEAIRHYLEVPEPQRDAHDWNILAQSYRAMGKLQEASKAQRKAISLAAEKHESHEWWASSLKDMVEQERRARDAKATYAGSAGSVRGPLATWPRHSATCSVNSRI